MAPTTRTRDNTAKLERWNAQRALVGLPALDSAADHTGPFTPDEVREVDARLREEGHGSAPTREELVDLLRRLRGDVPTAEVARRLGTTRQAVMELERPWDMRRDREGEPARWHISNLTLARLEELGEAYGVKFTVVARDLQTNQVITRDAPGLRAPLPDPPAATE